MIGWSYPEFKLNEDFTVQFHTNFGYGSTSYFYVKLNFKGIDILPFSDWVIYSGGSLYEIVRYSKKINVSNSGWNDAMSYVKDAFNLLVEDEEKFVDLYVIAECVILIKGLEYSLYNEDGFPYYANFHNILNSNYKVESKRLIAKYRGEKITGALSFIRSIEEYSSIAKLSFFIEKIEGLNLTVYPFITRELNLINVELEVLFVELAPLELEFNNAKKQYYPILKLDKRIESIVSKLKKSGIDNTVLKELFNKKFPDYKSKKDDYDFFRKKFFEVSGLIGELKRLKSSFDVYESRVVNYFKNVKVG